MDNSTDKNFITENGGLKVLLEPGEVTWFDFLYFSRLTNSLEGGWKGKSHWWNRGVLRLADEGAAFVPQWTKNSLQENALPLPRTGNFMFGRGTSPKRSDLEQSFKSHQNPIDESSENELSYALFNKGFGRLNPLDGIDLLGYEIPLAKESEGQLKVDLFGISPASNDSNAIEIVELKKANSTADSPLMMLTETICYALQTLRCRESLLSEALAGHELAFKQINLTLLASATYWNRWSQKFEHREKLETIVDHVNVGIQSANVATKLTLKLEILTSA